MTHADVSRESADRVSSMWRSLSILKPTYPVSRFLLSSEEVIGDVETELGITSKSCASRGTSTRPPPWQPWRRHWRRRNAWSRTASIRQSSATRPASSNRCSNGLAKRDFWRSRMRARKARPIRSRGIARIVRLDRGNRSHENAMLVRRFNLNVKDIGENTKTNSKYPHLHFSELTLVSTRIREFSQ